MRIELPYGRSRIVWDAPDSVRVLSSNIGNLKGSGTGEAIVRRAMRSPIGSPRLSELAKGKRTCAVIISDHTRPVPSRDILPPILEELRAGNPAIDITLLVATGCHRATTRAELTDKLGEELAASLRIVVHDCRKNNVRIGELPSGAPLSIDAVAAETELLIAEGFIEPHFFAGFSGGRKSVLPGICEATTVLGNHCSRFIDSPFARTGTLDGNPIQTDMTAAARLARLAYIVNVVIDEEKRTVAAFAGDFDAAHRAGCEFLRPFCMVAPHAAELVITTNGGAPLDQNLYQCVKSMTAAEAAAKEGGVIILCAECADGIGGESFYAALSGCQSAEALYDGILETPQEKTAPDQWQSQILARVLKRHPVILVTRKELERTVRNMKMQYAPSLPEAVEIGRAMTRNDAEITVIPNGVSVIVSP